MRLTLNKENWSGEQITINVNQKTRSWSQFGYRFELRLKEDSDSCTRYEIWGDGWDFALGTVTRYFYIEDTFDASTHSGDCIRTHENPFAAAAQLLCNII